MGKEAVAASAAKSSSIATTTNSSSINSTTDTNNALTDLWRKGDFERMNGSTFGEQTILIYKPIYVCNESMCLKNDGHTDAHFYGRAK